MERMKDAWLRLVRISSGADRNLLSRENVNFDTVRGWSGIMLLELIYKDSH